ncbi:MAG: type 4a pilus biogenesis protein PilO [Phycisphaerales bacterium]
MGMGIRQFMFLVLLLAVPIASYFMVFKPQNDEINRAKTEIELKQAMLEKLRAATAATADLEQANAEIAKSIDAVESKLPSNKELDNVLREVAAISEKCGLKVPKFKKVDKNIPSGGQAREQPLDLEVTGDFDGFYRFMQDLEKIPRITKIPDMKVARSDAKGAAKVEGDGDIKAVFTLTVYYQDAPAPSGEPNKEPGK